MGRRAASHESAVKLREASIKVGKRRRSAPVSWPGLPVSQEQTASIGFLVPEASEEQRADLSGERHSCTHKMMRATTPISRCATP